MRENKPVLPVLSVVRGKLFLRKEKFYLRNVTIAERLTTLSEHLAQEQAQLDELTRQEVLVRDSRNRAYASLGEETYAARVARLDQAKAALDEATSHFIEAQLQLRDEKEATLVALSRYGELRERAITTYDLLDDPITRLLDAMIAFWNVLDVETESRQLITKIGQSYLPHMLELSWSEWETLLAGNPAARAQLIKVRRGSIEQLKVHYLVKQ